MRIASRVFDLTGPPGSNPRTVTLEVHRPTARARFGWYTRIRFLDSAGPAPLHVHDWFGADALHSLTLGLGNASVILGSWQHRRFANDNLRLTWRGSDHLGLPSQPAWDPPTRRLALPIQRLTRAQRKPLPRKLAQLQRKAMERISARERTTRLAWHDLEIREPGRLLQRRAGIDFDAPLPLPDGGWSASARFLDSACSEPAARCQASDFDSLGALMGCIFDAASRGLELQASYRDQGLLLTESGQDNLDVIGVLGIPGNETDSGN